MGSISQSIWDCTDVRGYTWHFGVISVSQRYRLEGMRSMWWAVGGLLAGVSPGSLQARPHGESRQADLCPCCTHVGSWANLWGLVWIQPVELYAIPLWMCWLSYTLHKGCTWLLHFMYRHLKLMETFRSKASLCGHDSLWKDVHNAFKRAQSFSLSQKCSRSLFMHFFVG